MYKIRDILAEEAKKMLKNARNFFLEDTVRGSRFVWISPIVAGFGIFFLIRIRPNISVTKIILFKIARRSKRHPFFLFTLKLIP